MYLLYISESGLIFRLFSNIIIISRYNYKKLFLTINHYQDSMIQNSNIETNALNLSSNVYMNSTTKFFKGAVDYSLTPIHSTNNVQVPSFNSTNNLVNKPSPNNDFTPNSNFTQKTPVKPIEIHSNKPSSNNPPAELEVTQVIEETSETTAMNMAGSIFMNSTTKFMKGLTNLVNRGNGSASLNKQKNISPINKKAEFSPYQEKKTAAPKIEESPAKSSRTPQKTAFDLTGNNYMTSTTKYSKPAVGFSDMSIDNSKLLKFDTGSKKIISTMQVVSPAKSSISIESKVQIDKFHDLSSRGKNIKVQMSTVAQVKNDKGQASNESEAKRIERRKQGGRRELKYTDKKDEKQVIAQTNVRTANHSTYQRVLSPIKNQYNYRDQVSPAKSVQTHITIIYPTGIINRNTVIRDKIPQAKLFDGRMQDAKCSDSKFIWESSTKAVATVLSKPQSERRSLIKNQISDKQAIKTNVKHTIQSKLPSKHIQITKVEQKQVTPSKPVLNYKTIELSTTLSKNGLINNIQEKSVYPSITLISNKQTSKQSDIIIKQQIKSIKPIQRNNRIQKNSVAPTVKEQIKEQKKPILSPKKPVIKDAQIKQNNSKKQVQNSSPNKNDTTNNLNFDRLWGNEPWKVVRQLNKNQKIVQKKSPLKDVSKTEQTSNPQSNPILPVEEGKTTFNYAANKTSKLEVPHQLKLTVQEEKIDSKKKVLIKNQEEQQLKKKEPHQINTSRRNLIQSPSNNHFQATQNKPHSQFVSPQTPQQKSRQQKINNNIAQNTTASPQPIQPNTIYNPYQRKNLNTIQHNQNEINNNIIQQVTPNLPFQRTNVISPANHSNVQSIITKVVSPSKVQEIIPQKRQNEKQTFIKGQTLKPSSKNQIKSQCLIQTGNEIIYNGKKSIAIFQVLQKYYKQKIKLGFKSIKQVSVQSNFHKKQLNILIFSIDNIYTTLYASNSRLALEQLKKSWVNGTLVKKTSAVRENAKQNAAVSIFMRISSQKLRNHFQTIKQRSWINKQLSILQTTAKNGNKIQKIDNLNDMNYHLTTIRKIIHNYQINILQRPTFEKIIIEVLSNINKKKVLVPIISAIVTASKNHYKSNKPPRDYQAERQVLTFNKNSAQNDILIIERKIVDKKRQNDNEKAKLIRKMDEIQRNNKKIQSEVEIKRNKQKQLKQMVNQLPIGCLDSSLPEGEPLIGLLTEIYSQIFRHETETMNSQLLAKKYALVNEDHNPLHKEWIIIQRNITLKTQITKWQGISIHERHVRETISYEKTLMTKLLSNYVRQRYMWEWVRMTTEKI